MLGVSVRGRVTGAAVVALSVATGVVAVVWIAGSVWMSPELVRTLHLPPKKTGVWLVSCVLATLYVLVCATVAFWFCAYADRNGRVPPPPIKK